MAKIAIWAWRVALALFMFTAGVGPKDAQNNVSAWLDVVGLEAAARATNDFVVDPNLIWACALLIAVSFIPNAIRAVPRHVLEGLGIRKAEKLDSKVIERLKALEVANDEIKQSEVPNTIDADSITEIAHTAKRAEEMASALVAKERASHLQEQTDRIDEHLLKIDQALRELLEHGTDPKRFARSVADYKNPIRFAKENLEQLLPGPDLMGITEWPKIDQPPYNPHRATPGDDRIVDDEYKYDYRELYHNAQYQKTRLRRLQEKLKAEMNKHLGEFHTMMGDL